MIVHMVIDNTNHSQNGELSNQVFWYKADLHDDFRMCNTNTR